MICKSYASCNYGVYDFRLFKLIRRLGIIRCLLVLLNKLTHSKYTIHTHLKSRMNKPTTKQLTIHHSTCHSKVLPTTFILRIYPIPLLFISESKENFYCFDLKQSRCRLFPFHFFSFPSSSRPTVNTRNPYIHTHPI